MIKEHQRDVRLKHIRNTRNHYQNIKSKQDQILFDKTTTIANITSYFPRKYREAIQKHPNNLNRDNGYNINKIWKTILLVIEDRFSPPLSSPFPQFSTFPSLLQQVA